MPDAKSQPAKAGEVRLGDAATCSRATVAHARRDHIPAAHQRLMSHVILVLREREAKKYCVGDMFLLILEKRRGIEITFV